MVFGMASGDLEPDGFQMGRFVPVDREIRGLRNVLPRQNPAAGLRQRAETGQKRVSYNQKRVTA